MHGCRLFYIRSVDSVYGALRDVQATWRGHDPEGELLIEASTSAVIAFWQNAYVVGTMLAPFGFHALTWNVVTISLRQELVPNGLLGRVNSS